MAVVIETSTKLVPRPYQLEGIKWLYDGRRRLLRDDAGLGKTIQAAEAAVKPVLVSAPTYLTTQWYDFLCSQYPYDTVVLAQGIRKQREAELEKVADWYIVNEDMLRSYSIPAVNTIIFDEFHHYRNRSSSRAKAAAKIARNPELRIYGLTATPVWKTVDDLWMQLHILQPKIFSSYNEFVNEFCVSYDTPYGPKVVRIKKHAKEELQRLLKPIMWGRTYKDVGRQLPELITKFIKVPFPDSIQKVYDNLKNDYFVKFGGETDILMHASSIMHGLRQITAFPDKINAVCDSIEDNNGPHLVFVWYRETQTLIQEELKRRGQKSVPINGDTPASHRNYMVQGAARRKEPAIATISAMSEGVNAQMYRSVHFVEEHYPPGSNYQALRRVLRDRNADESTDPVVAYYYHVPHTIDEEIHKTAMGRERTIKELMGAVLAS